MLIAIISDTHDNFFTLDKALKYINDKKCEVLLHAGDMSRPETLDHIATKFHGPIHVVEGNSDIDPDEFYEVEKIFPNVTYHGKIAEIEIDSLLIGMTHKPRDAKTLAAFQKHDLVIHGHDHKPWQSFPYGIEVLNPGNVQDTRYPATFAIYDTKTKKPQLIQIGML